MKDLFIVAITILLAFLITEARAEYRAFELVIANKVTGAKRVTLSSLDPDQYRGYHALDANETIAYDDTWMCKGNTSNTDQVCKKPEKPAKGPAQNQNKP
jgi:hypothetical protein